jgi:hypothetical protein
MVVGLDFYTTSPPSLHSFRSLIRIGNALNGGTFHPKLYMSENAGGFCCIMESSNFTSGGFGDNAELNVCVEGGKLDPFFRQVSAFIEEQEKNSEPITKPEIADYRDQFEKLKAARKRLAKFRASTAAQAKAKAAKEQESTGEAPPKQLNKTWPEFVRLILAPKCGKRIDGSTAGNLDYLQRSMPRQTRFRVPALVLL